MLEIGSKVDLASSMHIQAQRGVVNALVYVIKLIFQLTQHLLSLSLAVERELDIASLRNFKPVAT